MASHRKREICKERKKVITSSERDEDREGEKVGPSTEDREEVDLYEDLALEDSDDSDEEEGVVVEEDTIVL